MNKKLTDRHDLKPVPQGKVSYRLSQCDTLFQQVRHFVDYESNLFRLFPLAIKTSSDSFSS